jgi:hypothetical protein
MFRPYYAYHQELLRTAVAASGFRINAEVDVFPAGWKNVHLGIYTEIGGCDCSLKKLLMMGIICPKHVEQRLCN